MSEVHAKEMNGHAAAPASDAADKRLVSRPPPGLMMLDPHRVDLPPGNRAPTLELVSGTLLPSVQIHGVLVPLLVCRREDAPLRYWGVDGNCRAFCARICGVQVPAVDVGRMLAPREVRLYRVTTSHVRNALSPLELADEVAAHMGESGQTQTEAAAHFGLSQGEVSRVLKLGKDLCPDLRVHVDAFEVVPSVAKLIATVKGHDKQRELMARAIATGAKRDAVRGWVGEARGAQRRQPGKKGWCGAALGFAIATKEAATPERFKALHARLGDALKKAEKEPHLWAVFAKLLAE
jgi:ParB/RepB/Spo0J family partition protein